MEGELSPRKFMSIPSARPRARVQMEAHKPYIQYLKVISQAKRPLYKIGFFLLPWEIYLQDNQEDLGLILQSLDCSEFLDRMWRSREVWLVSSNPTPPSHRQACVHFNQHIQVPLYTKLYSSWPPFMSRDAHMGDSVCLLGDGALGGDPCRPLEESWG